MTALRAPREQISILMIDDDDLDAEMLRRQLKKAGLPTPLIHARDGTEGLAILRGTQADKSISRPLLILLDLNMPKMDGMEFLRQLRADPGLHDLVVFMMTTSNDDDDIHAAYALNIAGYMVKSDLGHALTRSTELLDRYFKAIELR